MTAESAKSTKNSEMGMNQAFRLDSIWGDHAAFPCFLSGFADGGDILVKMSDSDLELLARYMYGLGRRSKK